jgi:flagellar hook capping protein FlgD
MQKLFITIVLICAAFLLNAQNYLNQPQKIVIDETRNRYIVSNFGNGGILVQIDSAGVQSPYITNAGMVDGMVIVGDTLYGSGPYPTGTVRGYDLNTDSLVMIINLSTSSVQHLSSFVADSNGIIYTSERFGTRIFKINPRTQQFWVFAQGGGIDQANGLLLEPEKNRLLVCMDRANPPIMSINLSDSTVSTLVTTTLAGSDGIAKDMNGNYYITGYELPGVYKFDSTFTQPPQLIHSGNNIIYPTYNEKNNSLLITYYWANNWGEIFLTPLGISNPIEFPENFILYQNYPNPFNPTTKISYDLPHSTNVILKIYNLQGQEIKTLVNESQQPGMKSVIWDGRDNKNSRVSSGVYIYSIYAGTPVKVIQNRKMLFLK